MARFPRLTLPLVALLVSIAQAQDRPNLIDRLPPAPAAAPGWLPPTGAGAAFGVRPGAGTLLMTPVLHFSNVVAGFELADDPARGVLWVICEPLLPPSAYIWPIDRVTLRPSATIPPLLTSSLDGGGPPGPDIHGSGNGIARLPSGNLLCADFNGDLTRFDDTLFEVNPNSGGNTVSLVNFWYLDSASTGCGGCRPNTNAEVPQRRIDTATGVDTSDSGIGGPGPIFVASLQGFYGISHVTLTPGTPGTWSLVRRYEPPTGGATISLDYDPDQAAQQGLPNVYWMTADLGTAIVMETTFTPGAGFSVNQCFPSFNGLFALTDAVAGLRGTAGPHQLASWRATTALNQATGVRMSAGSGPVTQPYPMEGDLFHSLESDSPRGGGLWERSGGVLDEEISLWSDGRSGARSHTTREHLQVLFTGGTMPGTALDFDAIEVDPAFAGTDAATDPSIHDFYLSITTDTVMGNPPVLVDNADVFQILENGGINKILTRAQLQAALGTTDTTIDVDAIAASKGTPASETLLYLSMWRSHSLSGSNPNLPATIREGDIVAVPVNPQPNSATLVYLTEEFAAITARFGHTMGPNVTNVSIDPNGNPSRPNPNPGGGTRPDVLFNDNLVPTHLKHIYSTRASSGTDGVIVRHQLTMGYGNVAGTAPIVIDALAAFPGATPSPTAEGAAALVGGQNFASFVARFHGARATVVWAVGISRLSPGVDYRPLLSHNLLCVVPDLLFTLVTDENGISELGLTGPALGFSIDVFAQAGGVYVGAGNGWALTTPFKVTWR